MHSRNQQHAAFPDADRACWSPPVSPLSLAVLFWAQYWDCVYRQLEDSYARP
jgi:hypothetical protein